MNLPSISTTWIFQVKYGFPRTVFEIQVLQAKIKSVFSRSYSCYGNLLCLENGNKVYPNDGERGRVGTMIASTTDKELL